MYEKKPNRKKAVWILSLAAALAIAVGGIWAALYWNLLPGRWYSASDFEIETVKSSIDYNGNGTDDYTDFLLGAREDAIKKPKYDGAYQPGGYPPDNIGVCTDVIWRAFRNAGYSLRDMVDSDIAEHAELYGLADGKADSNIDFRRVSNLKVFFSRYAQSLTLDSAEIAEWQPGDIVIFEDRHIGMISDRRTREGRAYLIHNGGQPNREEDALLRMEITGHYRFDASKIPESLWKPWKEQN